MNNTIRENENYEGNVSVALNYDTIAFPVNVKGSIRLFYSWFSGKFEECNDKLDFHFYVENCNFPISDRLIEDIRVTLSETLRDYLIEYIETGKEIVINSWQRQKTQSKDFP